MTLKEHIEDIRDKLEKREYPNESAVSQGIVLRLLSALNWSTFNTQVVHPEYAVEGGKVDFALCHPPSEPCVFIEVKQVGNIEGAEEQLFRYAFRRGVPIAVLTDGRKWRFFYPIGQGDYRDGEKIEHHKAIDTWIEVILKLGPDRVIGVDNGQIISTSPNFRHRRPEQQYGQYYIAKDYSTSRKKELLDGIAERLGVNMKVEIVDKS